MTGYYMELDWREEGAGRGGDWVLYGVGLKGGGGGAGR